MQKQHNSKLSVFIEFSLLPTFSHITCVKFQRQLLKHKKLSQYISGQNYSSSCDYYRHVNVCNYTALKSRFTCCHIVCLFFKVHVSQRVAVLIVGSIKPLSICRASATPSSHHTGAFFSTVEMLLVPLGAFLMGYLINIIP